MFHVRHLRPCLAVAAAIWLGGIGARPVRADPILLQYDSRGAGETTTIRFNGVDMTGFVGQFNMHLEPGPGVTLPGPTSFISYCVDLPHDVHPGQRYLVDVRSTNDGLNNGGEIAYLYNKYGQQPLTNDQAAGLQLAIWDIEYDNGDGLGTGTFQYLFNNGAATWAQNYLTEGAGKSAVSGWLDASPSGSALDRGQSVLWPDPPGTSVPEPTSLLLVGMGLAGGAAYRWYRRRGRSRPAA